MSDEPLPMLQGKFPAVNKMNKKDMITEITAWRNLWGYVPSEVKYYLLKSGTQLAVTMRNYKRHMGVLLSTRWEITELELGVYEKQYDQNTGKDFFERKIIVLNPNSVIDMQWIQERIEASKLAEMEQQRQQQEQQIEEEQ